MASKLMKTKLADGHDLFIGSAARDLVFGGAGRDEIYGGDGADRLYGGDGDDFLSGGRGTDRLYGGAGADTFCFDGSFGKDHVMDFNPEDGDSLMFIFYQDAHKDLTGDDLLGMCEEVNGGVVLALPDAKEKVTLYNTDLSDLSAEMFRSVFYEEPGLVA